MAGSGGVMGQTAGSAGQAGDAGSGGAAAGGVGGAGGVAGGGAGGTDGPATAFVPDVPEEYVGKIVDPGMTIVAHTARMTVIGMEWLMAVKNTGTSHLCAIDVSFSFLDSSGAKLGGGMIVPLDIPLERGSNGTGGLTSCLAPGKIGMLKDTGALQDVDVTKIAKVTHEFGAIILSDAAPTTDIKITDVTAVDSGVANYKVFNGTLKNDGAKTVKNPSVAVYGLNAAGRPLFSSEAIELVTVPAAGTWMFKTIDKFNETYTDFAAFPRVSEP